MCEKKKATVFVVMPFKNNFLDIYKHLKSQFTDYNFSNAGDAGNPQAILKDIIQPIYDADVIIADLTGLNPNVMYELGIAHAMDKKTIIITQDDISLLPFDLKSYRVIHYEEHFKKITEMLEVLEKYLSGAMDGSVAYSNPVKDFCIKMDSSASLAVISQCLPTVQNNSSKGFLDFLADLEENMELLIDDMRIHISDLNDMNKSIHEATDKIKSVSGSGAASFIRKETRKVAITVSDYNTKLKLHNKTFTNIWQNICSDMFGLLENKHLNHPKNIKDLIGTVPAMIQLHKNVETVKESVKIFVLALNSQKGLNKELDKSIDTLDKDLTHFLEIQNNVTNDIKGILNKQKFIIDTEIYCKILKDNDMLHFLDN